MSDMLAGNMCFNLFNIPVVFEHLLAIFGHDFYTLGYRLSSTLKQIKFVTLFMLVFSILMITVQLFCSHI